MVLHRDTLRPSEVAHVDESAGSARRAAVRSLTGGRAPGLEQEHNSGKDGRSRFPDRLRGCGRVGSEDVVGTRALIFAVRESSSLGKLLTL